MCDQNCIEWVRENIEVEDIRGKRVLEVGSFNVNGTLKPTLKALGPSEYIGVDIHAGSNVDILKTLEKSRTTIYTPVCTGEFRKAHVYGGEKRPKKVFQSFQGYYMSR